MNKLAHLIESQPISETSETLLNSSASLKRLQSPEKSIYASIALRLRVARGLPAKSLSENQLSASELAGILSDVPMELVEMVYQRAMKDYTDINQPFGAPQLRAAWESLKADTMREVSTDETRSRIDAALAVQSCKHEYVFIAREQSDPPALLGFYECRICLRSKPVFKNCTRENQPQLETT